MASVMWNILATCFIIHAGLQEGCGLPLSERAEVPAQAPHPHRVRSKRCSCSSWDDKECIYFCHLDIIWVNTPSKLLPYGLGNPLSRRRRSADRCECADPADRTCSGFCRKRPNVISSIDESGGLAKKSSSKLLASLRSLVNANMETAKEIRSSGKTPSGDSRLKSGTWR